MIIRFFISLMLVVSICTIAFTQARIKGYVVDAESQIALPNARVQVNHLPALAITESDGYFDLEVPLGEQELTVSCSDYVKGNLKVTIKNPVNSIKLKLVKREPLPLSPVLKELNLYREKVVLVTDKPYYYPGEIIWLKAFLNYFDATKKDSLSRVVYVELINKALQVEFKQILSLDSGQFAGSIFLPKEIPVGNYILRGYTRFMENFGEDQFFTKTIPILRLTDRVLPGAAPVALAEESKYKISPENENYKTRQKVKLNLSNLPEGDYSISVTDLSQVVPIPELNLVSSWGFDNGIEKIPAERTNRIVEKGISFAGQFTSESNTGKQVMLSLFRKDLTEMMDFLTDEKGFFQVNGIKFFDSLEYFYKAKKGKKGQEFFGTVKLNPVEYIPFKSVIPGLWFRIEESTNIQRTLANYLAPADVRMLNEVVVTASREEPIPDKGGIRGGADKVIKMSDLSNMGNLLLSLQGRVPGLIINCSTFPCTVRFTRATNSTISLSTEPLVLINDVPATGTVGSVLQNIDISIVDRVEVSARLNVLYGDQGRNGIIAVYLKDGVNQFAGINELTPSFTLQGFTRPMEFVNPDYENSNQEGSISDYRSTLYWNPELKRDAQSGSYACNFFTSDVPGRYRVVVQGVTSKHDPVYTETIINVKRE